MTTEAKHSPTPWSYVDDGRCVLLDANGKEIQDTPENRAYLLAAANAHDDLVAAVEVALEALDPVMPWTPELAGLAFKKLCAALAKAVQP